MRLSDLAVMIDLALEHTLPPPLDELCVSYPAKYYGFLHNVAKLCAGIAVELGVEKGRGCAAIASGNADLKVIGLDHTPREEWRALHTRFPNIWCYERASMPVPGEVRQAVAERGKISLLHVDTEHSFSMARAEFTAYEPYLAERAVVCFDDLHAAEDDVLKFFYSLPYPKIQHDGLHSCGYGVVLYER